MSRPRSIAAAVFALACAAAWSPPAGAQSSPLPLPRGTRYAVKIDSSPQQAAIYVIDKAYGIQGYTPSTIKLPKGNFKLILELPGFKSREVPITVSRAQAFNVTLERAPRPAILDLRSASDQNAVGGQILVDGTTVGTLPNRVEVGAGKHVVEVKKPGFHDYRDNIDVGEAETRTLVVALVAQSRPGSLLVTADVNGATVYVDGQRRDTAPALISDLPEGPHTVEVRVEGKEPAPPPWKQVVNVVAGQQAKVLAQLAPQVAAPPPSGSVKVLSSTAATDVYLDGEAKGTAGIEIKGVTPGSHIIEVRAQGFLPKRQEVTVAAGELRVIAIDLDPAVAVPKLGRLRVISPVPEVEVFVDGASVGRAPVDRGDLAPGKHFVVVRKTGFADYKVEVDLEGGRTTDIAAELKASGSIRVLSNTTGASVFLDGVAVGKTPFTIQDVGTGEHVVELKAPNFVDGRTTVRVEGGLQQIVNLDLAPVQTGPSQADLDRAQREQSSFGGTTLERGKFNVDVGAGFPYYLSARLITGIARINRHIGLDLGVDLRTYFFSTEVGIRPRVQVIRIDPFALGIDMLFSAGGGPTNRNNFTFEFGPIATILAGQYVHINVRPYLMVATDRLCPSVDDIKDDDTRNGKSPGMGDVYLNQESKTCHEFYGTVDPATGGRGGTYPLPADRPTMGVSNSPFGQNDPRDRFVNTRFMLQGSVEIAISKNLSIWGLIEGAPFQTDRWTFTKRFNVVFPDHDIALYGRAGITAKF